MRHVCHAVNKMGDTRVRFKCSAETVCGTCAACAPPIPNQRARVSSVEKTQSFSFSQVDMYAIILTYNGATSSANISKSWGQHLAKASNIVIMDKCRIMKSFL